MLTPCTIRVWHSIWIYKKPHENVHPSGRSSTSSRARNCADAQVAGGRGRSPQLAHPISYRLPARQRRAQIHLVQQHVEFGAGATPTSYLPASISPSGTLAERRPILFGGRLAGRTESRKRTGVRVVRSRYFRPGQQLGRRQQVPGEKSGLTAISPHTKSRRLSRVRAS